MPFDIIGAKKLYSNERKNRKWTIQWLKGVFVISLCWVFLSTLIVLIQPTVGFCLPVFITMIFIFQFHEQLTIFINSGKYKEIDVPYFKGQSKQLNCSENTFTGGIVCGFNKNIQIIPESWVASSYLEIECYRRNYLINKKIVLSSFLYVVFWNLLGVLLGEILGIYSSENFGVSIVCLSCWMTIWSFLALLLMPRLSHSIVYAADSFANNYNSIHIKKWIQRFAQLVDENGNENPILQSIFYPIPSADDRINSLGTSISFCFGNISRQNLFLSWGVLNLSCRSVHCNIGRPVLWVFPPSA